MRSWVLSANSNETDFPLENLPFGVFRYRGKSSIGVAIGDQIADLAGCQERGLLESLDEIIQIACSESTLDRLMGLGREAAHNLRLAVQGLLSEDAISREVPLVPQGDVSMDMPCSIGDYTDFYASIDHATNVGSMFRPDNPLLPNYKYVPIGYHGRASSIVASGTAFRRPSGQTRDDPEKPPAFAPSRRLDYEMEVGCFIGSGNELGTSVSVDSAEEHIFGLCLVNDWSARDIQAWEYQPLGPFLGKSFATSISPWIVTLDALEPFRRALRDRPEGDPEPLDYLRWPADRGIDIVLEVWLKPAKSKEPVRLSQGSFLDMYWTFAQLVAHHTSNGCNLRPGDLLASGTVSGKSRESRGSMLELAWRGSEPIALPSGEQRRFLEDGDEVIMRGYCQREGAPRIGFGEVRGVVLPAVP